MRSSPLRHPSVAGWGLHPRSPPSPPLERVQVELLAGAQQRMQVLVGSEIKMRKMHAARCLELEAAGMLPSYHPYARCTQPDVSSSRPQVGAAATVGGRATVGVRARVCGSVGPGLGEACGCRCVQLQMRAAPGGRPCAATMRHPPSLCPSVPPPRPSQPRTPAHAARPSRSCPSHIALLT